jgi:hypothetical protein
MKSQITFFNNEFTDVIDDVMENSKTKETDRTPFSVITPISPFTPIKYNSINIAVGRRGSGKTHSMLREIIRISNSCDRTHMLIYVVKNKDVVDPTFEKFKHLIKIPIEYVPAENLDETLKTIITYKEKYEKTIENQVIEEMMAVPEYMEVFQTILRVNDFHVSGLHTLIFIDDAVHVKILKPNSYVTSLLSENRQPRFSFFICIQFWKALNPSVKPNINTIFLFGTFSRSQISYILQQIPMNISIDEFYQQYQHLKLQESAIIDCDTGEFLMQ